MSTFKVFCLIIFAVTLSLSYVSAKKYKVPALIWGPGYEVLKGKSFPVLKTVSSEEFFNHVLKNIHKESSKSPVVLFIEETISTEDFGSRASKYETAFPMLEDISKKNSFEFLRAVENPVTALTSSDLKSYGFTFSDLSFNDLEGVASLKKGIIYTINLEDADSKEDRPEMLQRHDEKVASIYNKLVENNDNLVAILTGRYSSWTEPEEVIRVRRQANDTVQNETTTSKPTQPEASSGVVLETKTALIYTRTPPVLKIEDREILIQSSSGISDDREKLQRAVFSYSTELGKLNLRFRFEYTSNNISWSLSQVELEMPTGSVLLTANRQISAQYNHSFHTSATVVFTNKTSSLTFNGIQVQTWKSLSEDRKFGEVEDDTAFFTPPIWTGIIVIGIIGIILSWALSMIMDIRTMDQFDDPKGKTITVNVTD